jgi:imidazolonepropionase-like amidohydrolase
VKKIALLMGLVFCAVSLLPQSKDPGLRPLFIHHVTVIDATGAPPQRDMTVKIENGHITFIGAARNTREKESDGKGAVTNVDGTGKYLIPGLWDMHVHVAGVSADPKWSRDTLLPLLLANGIIGVRDMGGNLDALLEWRKQISAGTLLAPHLVFAGPMLELARQAQPEVAIVQTPEEGRKAVDDLALRGVDFIKVLSRLSRESFLAIAEEAHAKHLPLAGHVPFAMTAAEASDAGMKSIEHIYYSNLALDCSSKEKEVREKLAAARAARNGAAAAAAFDEAATSFSKDKADALWKTLLHNKTWMVPTLVAMEAAAHLDRVSANDPGLAYLPKSVTAEWAPENLAKENSPAQLQFTARQFENDKKLAGEMHRAGVRILAGSDSLDPYNFPGISLHRELELLVAVGFTPIEALQTATRNPAEFLGQLGQRGTVEKGKAADLVLLDANPLDDIANTRRIAAGILDGKYFSREDLDKMLAQARAAAQKN